MQKAGVWREQRRAAIEQGLAAVDARLAADLRTELGVLRESAAELLGLDLAVPEPGGRLAEDRRFFFATAEDAGQTELLVGAIRRGLPGELGRPFQLASSQTRPKPDSKSSEKPGEPHAARSLCAYATEHAFDLLVLGRHGYEGFSTPNSASARRAEGESS